MFTLSRSSPSLAFSLTLAMTRANIALNRYPKRDSPLLPKSADPPKAIERFS